MTKPKNPLTALGLPSLTAPPSTRDNALSSNFTLALLDAAGNGCMCGPCQLLRKGVAALREQMLQEVAK